MTKTFVDIYTNNVTYELGILTHSKIAHLASCQYRPIWQLMKWIKNDVHFRYGNTTAVQLYTLYIILTSHNLSIHIQQMYTDFRNEIRLDNSTTIQHSRDLRHWNVLLIAMYICTLNIYLHVNQHSSSVDYTVDLHVKQLLIYSHVYCHCQLSR